MIWISCLSCGTERSVESTSWKHTLDCVCGYCGWTFAEAEELVETRKPIAAALEEIAPGLADAVRLLVVQEHASIDPFVAGILGSTAVAALLVWSYAFVLFLQLATGG